jgi:MFS family permease
MYDACEVPLTSGIKEGATAMAYFVGLGTSSMLPMALSAAARLAGRAPATSVASLSQLAFLVSVLSPPIIGWVVGATDIRTAFLLGLVLLAVSAATVIIRRPFTCLGVPLRCSKNSSSWGDRTAAMLPDGPKPERQSPKAPPTYPVHSRRPRRQRRG